MLTNEPIAIVTPEQVTPAWMSQALACRGIGATVESLTVDLVGTGQLGETRRFHLNYKRGAPASAPRTLIGKFPSDSAIAASSGRSMGLYRAEVMFYRELAHRARIRTPDVYVAEINESNDFILLLEDMAPAVMGDQMRGCTIDEASKALSEAALLHATFWNDTELLKQDWLSVPPGAQGLYTTDLIEKSWYHVKKDYDGQLSPEVTEVCDRYVRNHAWWNRPRDTPKCFSHNDFRPDNLLFGGPDDRVAVVDWQTSSYLSSGMDAAYFLGGIFDRETRKANERDLLKQYHNDLLKHGVTDYDFDQMMRDYAFFSFAAIAVAMAATLIVKRTNRGDKLFMHMITGAAHQAIDNNALDHFPE